MARKSAPESGFQNQGSEAEKEVWMAHEECAMVVPETWVEEVEVEDEDEDQEGVREGEGEGEGKGDEAVRDRAREKVVFGVDLVVKDQWALVCLELSLAFVVAVG